MNLLDRISRGLAYPTSRRIYCVLCEKSFNHVKVKPRLMGGWYCPICNCVCRTEWLEYEEAAP